MQLVCVMGVMVISFLISFCGVGFELRTYTLSHSTSPFL
jgi:hypothetical protein